MLALFYLSAAVALFSTLMVITRRDAMHALLYLVLSFLALALVFYQLGAPFIAALEVIVYAGAIVVLFVFAVMVFDLGRGAAEQERQWLPVRAFVGPGILATILLGELSLLLADSRALNPGRQVPPDEVSRLLFGPYLIGVELGSILLLVGLVAATHLGRGTLEPRRQP